MKRASKLETAPQPISLVGRKHSVKASNAETPPYRIEWESPKLRPIENHMPISSASLISNMKQELSSIKLDVEKLISSEEPLESKLTQKMDIFNQSLKDELAYQKKVEEQLRKEVRELKLKLSDPKPREERLAFERKMEELKADKFKSDREKEVFQERIAKLQGELAQAQRLTQSKEQVKSGKMQQLAREFEKIQAEKKRLQTENAQLQLQLESRPKSAEMVDRQVQFSNTEDHLKLRNGMHELEKEKLALAGRLHDKEEQLTRMTLKYQTALKDTEAKYYNAISEFKSLEEQLRVAKEEEVSSLNQRVASLEEEVAELTKLNVQICHENDQLTIRNSKKDKQEETVTGNESLRRENGELMAVVAKLKQAYQLQQAENDQLQVKLNSLQTEMNEIQTVEMETLKQQICVLEDNIQTLHKNQERRLKEHDEASRTTKAEYVAKMNELAVGKKLAEEEIQVLRKKIQQAYTEYLLGKENEQAAAKNKSKGVESGCQTVGIETASKPKTQANKHNLGTQTVRQQAATNGCQTDDLPCPAPIADRLELEQLKSLRVQNCNLAIEINHLNTQIMRYHDELRSANEFSREKDVYILELERQKEISQAGGYSKELERKCQELAEEHSKVLEDYELKIMRLQNEVGELREKEKNVRHSRSRSSSSITQDTVVNFDEALRIQLAENDQLKKTLREKQEEMLQMRSQVEEWRRKADTLRTQTEIDKLRGVSEQKTLKSHYDITIQNIKQELESQRRKQETLQRKVDFKTDELRKKDEFIQQVIIGKVGRDAQQSELDYTKKELERLFSANYEERLFNALERIRELEDGQTACQP